MTERSEVGPEPAGADAVLSVEDVVKLYGDNRVLSDVSFEVSSGTAVALVGPNGSGKTTLLRIVAGLLAPTRGQVNRSTGVERPVGYLPQTPQFRPAFTVRETLSFGAALLAAPVDVDATLERLGLAAVADRRIDALSGGMRRLVGVGMAVLGDPPVVVLDEPTGDLDPTMTDHVFGLAAALADEGVAVLLATHDLTGAADADRVVALDRGEVVAAGTPADLIERTGAASFRAAFLALVGEEVGVRSGVER
ncbi:MAG: ABC transporter ATP-binding protein [Halobacteriales archaeon]